MNKRELLKKIKSAGRHDKFSLNLYRAIKKNCYDHHDIQILFSPWSSIDGSTDTELSFDKTMPSHLYIGNVAIDGWGYGVRMISAICQGGRSERYAYPRKMQMRPVDGWWERYFDLGKCAIDPEHCMYYERWEKHDTFRVCKWCGEKHTKRIEVERREVIYWDRP